MFNNILVCLDGTEFSEAIIPVIEGFASYAQSRVILLRVVISPSLIAGDGQAELEEVTSAEISDLERKAGKYLELIAVRLGKEGIDVQCVTAEGPVEETILACARAYHVNLIALASHRKNLFSRIFLSSIGDFLRNKTGIPVLSINPDVPNTNRAN